MNWRAIFAIVHKDLKVVLRSKGVLLPLLIVPLILTIGMPGILASLPRLTAHATRAPGAPGLNDWLRQAPATLKASLHDYNAEQRMVILLVVYYLAPMYLILPLMVSSVMAADSIAGEKERKTLEALLYTPTSDRELFLAKLLAAWTPALAVSWGGFVIYTIVANWAAWPTMGRLFFPPPMWLLLAFWVAPAVAGMGLGFTVLISARVNTFQEAYQLGGLIVIPIVVLIVTQVSGLLYFSNVLVFGLGLCFWIIDITVLWFGSRIFRRVDLAARL